MYLHMLINLMVDCSLTSYINNKHLENNNFVCMYDCTSILYIYKLKIVLFRYFKAISQAVVYLYRVCLFDLYIFNFSEKL